MSCRAGLSPASVPQTALASSVEIFSSSAGYQRPPSRPKREQLAATFEVGQRRVRNASSCGERHRAKRRTVFDASLHDGAAALTRISGAKYKQRCHEGADAHGA
jgi:hypothetical protein